MARRKKVTQEQVAQAMAFLGGLTAQKPDEGMDLMEVFAQGLYTGLSIGEKKARAEQRKREGNGEG